MPKFIKRLWKFHEIGPILLLNGPQIAYFVTMVVFIVKWHFNIQFEFSTNNLIFKNLKSAIFWNNLWQAQRTKSSQAKNKGNFFSENISEFVKNTFWDLCVTSTARGCHSDSARTQCSDTARTQQRHRAGGTSNSAQMQQRTDVTARGRHGDSVRMPQRQFADATAAARRRNSDSKRTQQQQRADITATARGRHSGMTYKRHSARTPLLRHVYTIATARVHHWPYKQIRPGTTQWSRY